MEVLIVKDVYVGSLCFEIAACVQGKQNSLQ